MTPASPPAPPTPRLLLFLQSRTDPLLPRAVRDAGGDLLRRARLLLWFSLIGVVSCVIVALNAMTFGLPILAAVVVSGVVTFLAGPAVLAFTSRIEPAVHMLMAAPFIYVLTTNLLTGLTLVHSIFALGILPVAALVLAGPRVALPWLLAVVVAIGALLVVSPAGFPAVLSTEGSSWISRALSGALVVTLSVFMLASVHESLRAAAQAEAEAARLAAERSAHAKGNFLAQMSHELRTPMHAVIGMSELLLESELDDTQREYAGIVRTSASSLLVLVNDLLDLSKIDAGRMTLEQLPVDLARESQLVVRLLSHQAESKGIKLELKHPATFPLVMCDPTRVRQILVNLVGNAVKFTERGEVTVSVTLDPLDAGGQTWVTLSVADTGIGIPPDRLSQVFQPFAQADAGTPRRFGGTGLGLSITRRLVDLMNGTIEVESEEGKGTRFHVRLPMPLAELEGETSPAAAATDGRGFRALIADDTPASLLLATRLLERRGFDVVTATDGQGALRAFESGTFDLVLLDFHMPGLDGVETTRAMRRTETGRRTPIVALSATALSTEREQCLAAGMVAFLPKPFRPAQLDELLDEVLPVHSAA